MAPVPGLLLHSLRRRVSSMSTILLLKFVSSVWLHRRKGTNPPDSKVLHTPPLLGTLTFLGLAASLLCSRTEFMSPICRYLSHPPPKSAFLQTHVAAYTLAQGSAELSLHWELLPLAEHALLCLPCYAWLERQANDGVAYLPGGCHALSKAMAYSRCLTSCYC